MVKFELSVKQKALLIWLCFSVVTALFVVGFSSVYALDSVLRLFFTAFFILNLPMWLFMLAWYVTERAHLERWKIFLSVALVVNYLCGLGVLHVWRYGLAGYFIFIASSFLAGIVFNNLSDTIVYVGVNAVLASVAAIFMMLSPLLIYGAPVEQINIGILLYGKEILVQLMIFGPLCIFSGIVGCFIADWIFRRYTFTGMLHG